MSSHPCAKLVYGIDLGSEDEFDEDGPMFPLAMRDGDEDYDLVDTAERESGAERVIYGSYDYPGHILGFEVESSPDWGAIPLPPLTVDPTWDAKIYDLARRLGANVEGKTPGWHIAAFYG